MTTKHCRLNGKFTTDDDPQRWVWYSSRCKYWTDDWSKLKLVGPGIPSCPCCGKQSAGKSAVGDFKRKSTP